MSPSVLSYGNVDNDKVVSTNTKMAEIPKRLNKTHRRFQNLALKWFQCLLIIIIYSNQSFNQSITKFTGYYYRTINLRHIYASI